MANQFYLVQVATKSWQIIGKTTGLIQEEFTASAERAEEVLDLYYNEEDVWDDDLDCIYEADE